MRIISLDECQMKTTQEEKEAWMGILLDFGREKCQILEKEHSRLWKGKMQEDEMCVGCELCQSSWLAGEVGGEMI